MMYALIDQQRHTHGVEPMCKVLQIAPSGYRTYLAKCKDASLCSARTKRDQLLRTQIERIWQVNFKVYGADKVWHQIRREGAPDGLPVARCTVERLMRDLGLRGVRRGKHVRTTVANQALPCPLDRVNRQFKAQRPNVLWVSDFTYVSTWQGMVYVAFVIDVYARVIVGWRVSRSMTSDFVLDALEQALYARRGGSNKNHTGERSGDTNAGAQDEPALVHHSDRGSQYLSIRYTERLKDAGIEPSVGSTGDSYDNALAETINGLYKAEVIHRRTSWQTVESVELATLTWVAWFNNHRLLEPIGYIPPAEAEANYYRALKTSTPESQLT
jgi:transposase InsO family protein